MDRSLWSCTHLDSAQACGQNHPLGDRPDSKEFFTLQDLADVPFAMKNPDYTQTAGSFNVVDSNHGESLHWPGAEARNRTPKNRPNTGMPLQLPYALPHRFTET